MDRRPSHDDRTPSPESAHTNVFDDEFEVDTPVSDGELLVADGFRPEGNSSVNNTETTTNDQVYPKHSAEAEVDQYSSVRNSLSKGQKPAGPSGLNDGFYGRPGAPDSQQSAYASQSLMHRDSIGSTASFVTTARSSTPMGGPSHPYAMHPQGTGPVRTSSIMTSSTVRAPQRSYSGQRPAHPYALYPQNVAEDDEVQYPQQTIPMGFPGHDAGYHRRIGPDGEEQDIIGPDGHTEQLPPYSRYPEEPPKPLAAVSPLSTSSPVEAPPLPPTLNRSGDSAQTANEGTDVQQMSAIVEQSTTSSGSEESGEKRWSEKNWKEKRRTKLCGRVPVWLILLLSGLFVLFAIILGSAIGATKKEASAA